MFNECRHIKTSETRCHSPALRDSGLCYFHAKLHRIAIADKSLPAPPMKVPLLEDAGAIQIALGQVIDAIASARIDHRTASLLLYALQIGAQGHRVETTMTIAQRYGRYAPKKMANSSLPRLPFATRGSTATSAPQKMSA